MLKAMDAFLFVKKWIYNQSKIRSLVTMKYKVWNTHDQFMFKIIVHWIMQNSTDVLITRESFNI
jgi:hypothetical protein